jgi:hypothetical protein
LENELRSVRHPVWNVYDEYRTARLNVKYYSTELARFETLNIGIDVILAITVPSSSIAALWFLNTPIGHVIWQYLGAISVILAVIKPFLKLPEKMRKYERTLTNYRALEHDLSSIVYDINQNKRYDETLQNKFREAFARKGRVKVEEPAIRINKRLRRKCFEEVIQELPADNFLVPEE